MGWSATASSPNFTGRPAIPLPLLALADEVIEEGSLPRPAGH
jgi:hypothetical protein